MSRFDDCDNDYDALRSGGWENATNRALRGRRGLAVLQEVEKALIALPQPRLIYGYVVKDGEYCVVGAYCKHRGVDLSNFEKAASIDDYPPTSEDTMNVGASAGMQHTIACLLANMNDEECRRMTPEQRFDHILMRVRKYIAENPYSK